MREDYSYFADGTVNSLTDLDDTAGSNPPVTLRFLSRAYRYDHVGRVTSGFGTGNAGQGVPYSQGYSYDQFGNTTSRSGKYYNYNFSAPNTDTAIYTNNRRSNWSYNADGQVISTPSTTTDLPRTMTYDAAGRMLSTVETGPTSTVTYSVAYDGESRMVRESSSTSPGMSALSYIVRSTVLGGEVLTRLDASGNKLTTNVPAQGLLFASQRSSGAPGPFVMLTQRNPLGISETSRAVYDPLGNYVPYTAHGDPRPPVGSYTSASMRGLSTSQANPDSLAVGCIMDGMPTSCNRVANAVNRGQARSLELIGKGSSGLATAMAAGFIPQVRTQQVRGNFPDPLDERNAIVSTVDVVDGVSLVAPGGQRGFTQTPQKAGPVRLGGTDELKKLIEQASSSCKEAVKKLLTEIASETKSEFSSNDPMELFNQITSQAGGGGLYADITHDNMRERLSADSLRAYTPIASGSGEAWTFWSSSEKSVQRIGIIYLRYSTGTPQSTGLAMAGYLVTAFHEMTHIARKDGTTISHDQMNAAAIALKAASFDDYIEKNCVDKKYWGRP
jgi:YD repeat-containing protein